MSGTGLAEGGDIPPSTPPTEAVPPVATPPVAAPPAAPPPADAAPTEPNAAPAEVSSGPKLSGFVNTSYNYNVNRPATGLNAGYSYHAQHDTFMLNAAHLAVTGSPGKGVSYTVELDAGADAAVNQYANKLGIDDFDVQEAYVQWLHDKVGLKVGKFVTYEGIEVIEGPANPTISRGYLFGLAEPFTHVGAVGIFQVTPKVDVQFGLVNGWDQYLDADHSTMVVGKVGLNNGDPLALTISGYFDPGDGANPKLSLDATGVTKVVKKMDLWFQVNYGMDDNQPDSRSWVGIGVQPVVHLSDELSLGTRVELFMDKDGARGGDERLVNVSVAPAYMVAPGFLLRGEARFDIAKNEFYVDHDGMPKKNQLVLLADATVSF